MDARHEALASDLHAACLRLLRRVRLADRALGVTPARLSALSVLVFGGTRRLTELAEAEQVSAPTMSRIVAGLEAAGLVERRTHPGDARAVELRATPAGRRTVHRGRRLRVERLAAQLGTLSHADLRRLERAVPILQRLCEGKEE